MFRLPKQSTETMKIVINDLLAQIEHREEKEIDSGRIIRFEVNETGFNVSLSDQGIQIHKVDNSLGSSMKITPIASNVIEIR